MALATPNVTPGVWDSTREGSFAGTVATGSADGCDVALLGIPDDTGVQLNGGNTGAAQGPSAFRAALSGCGVEHPSGWSWPRVFDAGDVVPGASLAETHGRVTEAAGEIFSAGLLPVAVGGGHDLTFPFVRAATRAQAVSGGVYLDAHLDVRETDGSGMPFRRLIEDCGICRLDVIGLDRAVNSEAHTRWYLANGGRIGAITAEDPLPEGQLFVSIDLDAIDASHAPGVSARNPAGLTAREAADWARAAGRCPRVRCFDIMELCPARDENGRTARLAAHLFLSFLRGLASRLDPSPSGGAG
ncbi:MAG: formimidoylglutamase [Planctomycetota bacterium]